MVRFFQMWGCWSLEHMWVCLKICSTFKPIGLSTLSLVRWRFHSNFGGIPHFQAHPVFKSLVTPGVSISQHGTGLGYSAFRDCATSMAMSKDGGCPQIIVSQYCRLLIQHNNWLVVTGTCFYFHILGMSSSQLMNSYFSEGLKPPTSYRLFIQHNNYGTWYIYRWFMVINWFTF